MAKTTSKDRQKRGESRERRRGMAAKPFEEADKAARKATESKPGGDAVKQALATAAAGALAAGIAGAAKALHDRHDRDGAAEQEGAESTPKREAEEHPDDDGPETTEPMADATDAETQESPDGEVEPDAKEEAAADEPRGEAEADGVDDAAEQPKRKPTSGRDAQAVVREARQQLQDVLGVEPETVSGFERSENGWAVNVEVVEVRRVPDSTDVLSSYEVTLDDDRNLVGISQKRRYRRSQVEEG